MTTANKITIFRIVLIPVFVLIALYYGRSVDQSMPHEWMRWAALTIFLVAAASDGIDGYIARKYNQQTELGALLDPIADKGLLLSGIITLSVSNWKYEFPLWFPVLVISRDLVILAGAFVVKHLTGDLKVQPSFVGKSATALQMTALAAAMALQNDNWILLQSASFHVSLIDLVVILAGLATLFSGIGYVVQALRSVHLKDQ